MATNFPFGSWSFQDLWITRNYVNKKLEVICRKKFKKNMKIFGWPYKVSLKSLTGHTSLWLTHFPYCTVKLARAKLPANAGNFTCSSQVKRSLAQFTCVTCSLPVNTGKFTCFEAASTSRRTHATCLRAHVNLPEYYRYFTGSFTCGTHSNLPATSMQNCLLLLTEIHATYRQKHRNRR